MNVETVVAVAIGGFVAWTVARMFLGKVPAAKARELVNAGATLLDVRTPGEYVSGHVRGAKNVPVQELASRMGELGAKSGPIVVYCASGVRSAAAKSMLKRAGFTDVHDLGAMSRWPG